MNSVVDRQSEWCDRFSTTSAKMKVDHTGGVNLMILVKNGEEQQWVTLEITQDTVRDLGMLISNAVSDLEIRKHWERKNVHR